MSPTTRNARGNAPDPTKPLRVIAGLVLVAATVVLGGWLAFISTGNLHDVSPGVCYRAAQPSATRIEDAARHLHLRSIVNLRGDCTGTDWYDEEVAATTRLGITLINFRMSASKCLTPSQCDELSRVIVRAPKPTLIHCKDGADRTGLASALYLISQGATYEEAARQLSLRYFHFPWFGSPSAAMDTTLGDFIESQRGR